jgi:hypothetical protein
MAREHGTEDLVLDILEIGNEKYTIEELNGNHFIVTFWDKEICLEFYRDVKGFETYSCARAYMYRKALLSNCQMEVIES